VSAEPETPWALLKRLRAEGHPHDVVVSRLKALGLDDEDVKVLMLETPPAASGMEMPDAVKVAAVLAGGPVLGGLLIASMQDATLPREPPPPQVELADADPSPRCAQHVKLASVGTCPRCGGFVCRDCAGESLSAGCKKCQASPALRDQKVKAAARAVGIAGLAVAGLIALLALIGSTHVSLSLALGTVLLVAPPAIFSTVQLAVRSPWPGIVSLVCMAGEVVLFSVAGGGPAGGCGWILGIAVQSVLLSRLLKVRKAA
jgi:hypothetical protein